MIINHRILKSVLTLAGCLALFVVILGAYTRLTDSGLGCPDWPFCYGHLLVSGDGPTQDLVLRSQAWTEMIHRYCASILGLCVLSIVALSWKTPQRNTALFLLAVILFQGALGMWTVTLKLHPLVVMGHLLGGMTILATLWTLRFQHQQNTKTLPHGGLIRLGAVLVFFQIALGGWVSSNYAGLACTGFPLCHGEWLPVTQLQSAFNIFQPIGANYQGGLLDIPERVTIQLMHRLGAFVVFLYLSGLAWILRRYAPKTMLLLLALLGLQLILGVLNVVYQLPLAIAVMHNGVAALLLITLMALVSRTRCRPQGNPTL